jgi:hypothetical protein
MSHKPFSTESLKEVEKCFVITQTTHTLMSNKPFNPRRLMGGGEGLAIFNATHTEQTCVCTLILLLDCLLIQCTQH